MNASRSVSLAALASLLLSGAALAQGPNDLKVEVIDVPPSPAPTTSVAPTSTTVTTAVTAAPVVATSGAPKVESKIETKVVTKTAKAKPTPAKTEKAPTPKPTPAPKAAKAAEIAPPPMVQTDTEKARQAEAHSSYWLEDYPLNDLLQFLAKQAGLQYFQNSAVDQRITGELFKHTEPVEAMNQLALQYNLVIYHKGRTVYALTTDQMAGLPQIEYRYELKYLRPNQDRVKAMLAPLLTPGHGSAQLEDKVNTIVIVDNEPAIQRIANHLRLIDKPKRQISITTRILTVSNVAQKRVGVDWSGSLGNGISIGASYNASLSNIFGVPLSVTGATTGTGGTTTATAAPHGLSDSLVLTSPQISAVIRALMDNTKVVQESAPSVMTEDNEPALVSVVQRRPIVTSTVTQATGTTNISKQVRYKIDADDATDPPEKRREIGTQMSVTPTILPDNTIRLVLKPRVATVVDQVVVNNGSGGSDTYPVVNESSIENVARVPNGCSLVLGGFTQNEDSNINNKVPLLGDIPLLGQLFRSKDTKRSRSNLVFIITPSTYDPDDTRQVANLTERERQKHVLSPRAPYSDPQYPTQSTEPDIRGRFRDDFLPPAVPEAENNPLSPDYTGGELGCDGCDEKTRPIRRAAPVSPYAK